MDVPDIATGIREQLRVFHLDVADQTTGIVSGTLDHLHALGTTHALLVVVDLLRVLLGHLRSFFKIFTKKVDLYFTQQRCC